MNLPLSELPIPDAEPGAGRGKFRPATPTGKNVGSGLALAAALLVAIGLISYRSTTGFLDTAVLVAHSRDVETQLRQLLAEITDIETSGRGYVITGNEEYLEPYRAAVGHVDEGVKTLRRLTEEDPGQHGRVEALDPLVKRKVESVQQVIHVRTTAGMDAAADLVRTERGKQLMDAIRALIDEMTTAEGVLLQHRQVMQERDARFATVASTVLTSVMLVLLAAVAHLFRREVATRELAKAQLQERVTQRTAELSHTNAMLREEVAERRRAETRFRDLFESVPDAMVILNAAGKIVLVNAQTERLFGYTRQELLGQPVERLLPERLRARHAGHLATYFAAPHLRAMGEGLDLLGVRRDGTEIPLDISLAPIEIEGETLVTGAIHDISERKQAERVHAESERLVHFAAAVHQALAKGEAMQSMLQRCADAMVQHLDAAFARIWTLNEAEQMLELQASAGLYTHLDGPHGRVRVGRLKIGLIAQDRRPHLTNAVLDDPRIGDHEWARREGLVAFAGYPLLVEGRVVGVIAMFARRPLSASLFDTLMTAADGIAQSIDRKRVEEEIHRLNQELEQRVIERTIQLEIANRELEAFGHSVAHDLRSPLSAILGFGQILNEDYADRLDEAGQDMLHRLIKQSERMDELIRDLFALSSVTRSAMTWETIDLSALVRGIAAELQQRTPERRVTVIVPDNVVAAGDARLLRVALENMLGNAWKYTSRHATARIEFGTSVRNGEPVYFVRDDGAGFDMARADRLFEAFQRLHTDTEFEGTGVGLATVHRIVQVHGGHIWAEGATEQGATFYFTLGSAPTTPA